VKVAARGRPSLRESRWIETALAAAVGVPIVYFGIQVGVMPLHSGYDALTQPASALGAHGAPYAWLFNLGVLSTGLLTIAAAWGTGRALAVAGARPILAWLAGLALLSSGLASLNAGFFHLPDPRHNPGWLGTGMFLFPPILLAAVWRFDKARGLRLRLLLCLAGIGLLAPIMAGLTPIDRASYGGLLQRFVALALLLPVSFAGLWLFWRLRSDRRSFASRARAESRPRARRVDPPSPLP